MTENSGGALVAKTGFSLVGLSVGVIVALALLAGGWVALGAIGAADPSNEGPPEFRADLAPSTSAGAVLTFLADAAGDGKEINWIRLEDNRLVVRFAEEKARWHVVGCAIYVSSFEHEELFDEKEITFSPAVCA